VDASERDEFLLGVDLGDVVVGVVGVVGPPERAADERVVAVGDDGDAESGDGERLQVVQAHHRYVQAGQPGGHVTDGPHSGVREIRYDARRGGRGPRDERGGPAGAQPEDGQQQRESSTGHGERRPVELVDDADERAHLGRDAFALDVGSGDAPELAYDHEHGAPGEVADEQGLGEQVGNDPELGQAGEQYPGGDDERQGGRQRRGPRRVAPGERRDGGAGHQGDRRFRAGGQHT
jgi:hypothetical protein